MTDASPPEDKQNESTPSTDVEGTSAADALIETLKSDGDAGGEAEEFTLDRDVAREKLRKFQLPDARQYVLKLAQAGVQQGATSIRFDIDSDDMHVRFDGAPFCLDDFENLYSALFVKAGAGPEGGQHPLAIGLNAAMSLRPERVLVRSGDGARGVELEMRPDVEDVYRKAEAPDVVTGTQIHLKSPWSTELLTRVGENALGRLPEEEILRERCRYATVEIDLEDEIISKGVTLAGSVLVTDIQGENVSGKAGFDASLGDRSEVRFLQGGIWVATHRLPGLPDSFLAVVEGTDLRLDLSQVEFIRDEAFDACMQHVDEARRWCIEQLAEGVTSAKVPKGLNVRWARERLRQALRPANERKAYSGVFRDDRAIALARVPLWPVLKSSGRSVEHLSLNALFEAADAGKSIGYLVCGAEARSRLLAKRSLKPPEQDLCLVVPSEGGGRYFEKLLGEGVVHLEKLQTAVDGAVKQQTDDSFDQETGRSLKRWLLFFVIASAIALFAVIIANQDQCDQTTGYTGNAEQDAGVTQEP